MNLFRILVYAFLLQIILTNSLLFEEQLEKLVEKSFRLKFDKLSRYVGFDRNRVQKTSVRSGQWDSAEGYTTDVLWENGFTLNKDVQFSLVKDEVNSKTVYCIRVGGEFTYSWLALSYTGAEDGRANFRLVSDTSVNSDGAKGSKCPAKNKFLSGQNSKIDYNNSCDTSYRCFYYRFHFLKVNDFENLINIKLFDDYNKMIFYDDSKSSLNLIDRTYASGITETNYIFKIEKWETVADNGACFVPYIPMPSTLGSLNENRFITIEVIKMTGTDVEKRCYIGKDLQHDKKQSAKLDHCTSTVNDPAYFPYANLNFLKIPTREPDSTIMTLTLVPTLTGYANDAKIPTETYKDPAFYYEKYDLVAHKLSLYSKRLKGATFCLYGAIFYKFVPTFLPTTDYEAATVLTKEFHNRVLYKIEAQCTMKHNGSDVLSGWFPVEAFNYGNGEVLVVDDFTKSNFSYFAISIENGYKPQINFRNGIDQRPLRREDMTELEKLAKEFDERVTRQAEAERKQREEVEETIRNKLDL